MRKMALNRLHAAEHDRYFRECIAYVRKYGTKDMKIFACCMRVHSYWIYKQTMKVVEKMYAKTPHRFMD